MTFELPKGCIDMGEMNAAQLSEGLEAFRSWVHLLASSLGTAVAEVPADGVIRSFDVFELRDVGSLLLRNRFVGVVGAIDAGPVPGRGWAVDREFVELTVAGHLRGWGPVVPVAADLNATLTDAHWGAVSPRARAEADRYKPETVAQVLFNYWD